MASKSLKKNFIFNLIYQLLVLIVPLIVTPYVSRVLGVDTVGEYSYANSIVSYFTLFAVLGTGIYGQRAVSFVQENKEERSRAFWEVFIFRCVTVLIVLSVYALFIMFLAPTDSIKLYVIFALSIINVALDISWFLQGMEEFVKTAIISMIIKVFNVVSIYLLVKSPNDLWIYILIMCGFSAIGSLCLWIYMPSRICKVKGIKPFRNFKGIILLFLPTIATQIYLVLDKSMLGWFTNGYVENGYYEQAEKVVKVATTVVTALGTVMIPRIANMYKNGDMEGVKVYLYKSYRYVWMMAIPIMFGLSAVAEIFVPIFFGEGYDKCALLIPLLSVLTIFLGLGHVTGLQYFVPTEKQNVLTVTYVIGAVVNLIFNAILIPFYGSVGAAIGSIVAEFSVAMSGLIYVRKKKLYEIKPVFTCSWKYWIAGLVMFGTVYGVRQFLPTRTWALCVLILLGVVVYGVLLLIMRDAMLVEYVNKILGKVKALFSKKTKSNNDEVSGVKEETTEVDVIANSDVVDINVNNDIITDKND